MAWEDIERAVQVAIVTASRLPARQVIWSYQPFPEPTLDYVRLSFGGETVVGFDRIATTQDLTRPAGQEMGQVVRGLREVPLELECFSADVYGSSAARRLAELIRTRIQLDTIRYPLNKAGITPFDSGPVNWIPDSVGIFRGRATLTLRCYVAVSEAEEYTGYIARIRGVVFPSGAVWASGFSGYAFDSTRGASGIVP